VLGLKGGHLKRSVPVVVVASSANTMEDSLCEKSLRDLGDQHPPVCIQRDAEILLDESGGQISNHPAFTSTSWGGKANPSDALLDESQYVLHALNLMWPAVH
jgi:hypothetical protein